MARIAPFLVVVCIAYSGSGLESRAQVPPKALQNAVSNPEAALQRFDTLVTNKQNFLTNIDEAGWGVSGTPNIGLPGVPPVAGATPRAFIGEALKTGRLTIQNSQ